MRYYTLILAGIISAVFAIQSFFPAVTELFLLSSDKVLQEPYRLLTSIFLHGSFLHLGYNMIALALFGLVLESIAGWKRFMVVFFAAGAAASMVSAFFYPYSLGASGAVFGVIGALVVLRPRMTAFALGVPMPLIAAAAVWLFLDLAGVFFPSDVANMAHIAGLASGILAGTVWLRRLREKPKKKKAADMLQEEELKKWEESWRS